jgi:hypothetical protein
MDFQWEIRLDLKFLYEAEFAGRMSEKISKMVHYEVSAGDSRFGRRLRNALDLGFFRTFCRRIPLRLVGVLEGRFVGVVVGLPVGPLVIGVLKDSS